MSIFSEDTWRESRDATAFAIAGHTESMYNRGEIGPGDFFLCWIKGGSSQGLSRMVAVQRIESEAYERYGDEDRIWASGQYPIRFDVEMELRVPVGDGVSLDEIKAHSGEPDRWNYLFRNPGHKIPEPDAEWIIDQLKARAKGLGPADPEPGEPDSSDDHQHDDGEQAAAGPEANEQVVIRKIRDSALSRWVKRAHDGVCQICGETLFVADGNTFYAEGAHIKPIGSPHNGPDVPSNMLCLCPNDHVRLDRGALTVDSQGQIFTMPGNEKVGELRRVKRHRISPEYLEYRAQMLPTKPEGS